MPKGDCTGPDRVRTRECKDTRCHQQRGFRHGTEKNDSVNKDQEISQLKNMVIELKNKVADLESNS